MARRILTPIARGLLIDAIQAGFFAGYLYYHSVGFREPASGAEFGNWHLQAQLFWLTGLLAASVASIFLALRSLGLPQAGMWTVPALMMQLFGCVGAAPKLPGPEGVRLVAIMAVMPTVLLVLTLGFSQDATLVARPLLARLQGFALRDRSSGGSSHPRAPTKRAAVHPIVASVGIGVQVGFAQLTLFIFFQYWGVYEPPSNLLHLRLDNQLTWFLGLIGAPSIVLVYLALRRLRVRYAAWLMLPTVIVQFEVCAVIATQVNSLGYLVLLAGGVLPAQLIGLTNWLGVRRPCTTDG